MNYTVPKFQVQLRVIDGGMANLAFKHYFGWPSSYDMKETKIKIKLLQKRKTICFALTKITIKRVPG